MTRDFRAICIKRHEVAYLARLVEKGGSILGHPGCWETHPIQPNESRRLTGLGLAREASLCYSLLDALDF